MGDVTLSGSPARLTVVMRGKLDQTTAVELRSSVSRWIEERGEPPEVLFDLRDVEDYDILGRGELVAMHGALANAGRRCAYVTTHPRIRGLAILTIGEVGDAGSRAVATLEQGDAWLRRRATAETAIEQGTDPRRRG